MKEARKLAYAPGLDGLRGIACLAVLLYHAGVFHFTGGFLGVTVFFTLSGFLITSLLLEELRSTNRIDMRDFWRRRVYRIIPLFWLVSATAALWAVMDHSAFGRSTLAGATGSMFFVANWVSVTRVFGGGLLNANWSVSVEEQFYFTWPLALGFLYRRVRSERVLAGLVLALATAVATHRWMLAPHAEWKRLAFGTDTQADALLIGCAVALGLRCRSRALSIAAGIGLIALFFLAREDDVTTARLLMPGAALCTALLLPYLQEHPSFLGWRPFVAIGRRSYGVYLWGTPIVVLLRYGLGVTGMPLLVITMGCTFAVNELTYRFVEVPMRRRGRRAKPDPGVATRPEELVPIQPIAVGTGGSAPEPEASSVKSQV